MLPLQTTLSIIYTEKLKYTKTDVSNLKISFGDILRPSSNQSPYIFMLDLEVKYQANQVYALIITARSCQDSASYFI